MVRGAHRRVAATPSGGPLSGPLARRGWSGTPGGAEEEAPEGPPDGGRRLARATSPFPPLGREQILEAVRLGRGLRLIRGRRSEESLLEVTPVRSTASSNRSWSVALDPLGAPLFVLRR